MSDFAICRKCCPYSKGWRRVYFKNDIELWITDGPGHDIKLYSENNFSIVLLGMTRDMPKVIKWAQNKRLPEELIDAVGCMACGAVIDPDGFSAFRDKTGLIPIVEFEAPDGVYAVTTSPDFLGELTAHSRIRASWAANYLAVQDDCSTADVMENVERLRAGEITEYKNGKRTRHEYWPGPSFYQPFDVDCGAESAELLRAAFVKAVSRIPHDKPCTYSMSGGLDSCGIIGVTIAHSFEHEYPMRAASLISERYAECDESREIDIMERHFGLSVDRINMDEKGPEDLLLDSYRFNAFGPQVGFGNKSALMLFNRVAETRPQSRIVLGMGGNYLVDGYYETLWIDMGLRKDWQGLAQELRYITPKQLYWLSRRFAANICNGKFRSVIQNILPKPVRDSVFSNVLPENMLGNVRNSSFVDRYPVSRTTTKLFLNLQKLRISELRSWQTEFCRRSTDNYMRLTGVQFYDPLFDPDLCETCARLPMRAFFRQNKYRPAYIEALSPFLPEEILYHPKVQSFDTICNLWLTEQARPIIERILKNCNSSSVSNFINTDVLYHAFCTACDNLVNNIPMHPIALDAVWRAVSICL